MTTDDQTTKAAGTVHETGAVSAPIHLTGFDRRIVECGTGWRDEDTVGFCLRVPGVQ